METHYLYTISDPRCNSVFYVGRTRNPRTRFSAHMSNKKMPVWRVVQSIKKDGLKPIFSIIKEGDARTICNSESALVKKLHTDGVKLLNHCVNRLHRDLPYELNITNGLIIKRDDLTILNRG